MNVQVRQDASFDNNWLGDEIGIIELLRDQQDFRFSVPVDSVPEALFVRMRFCHDRRCIFLAGSHFCEQFGQARFAESNEFEVSGTARAVTAQHTTAHPAQGNPKIPH